MIADVHTSITISVCGDFHAFYNYVFCESGYSITGLVVGIIFAALLVTVAVITLGILCK